MVWDRVITGELSLRVRQSRPAPPPGRSGQPEGTLSQLIDIFESSGAFLASAHRYLRPGDDPRFGGRPDPKRLVVNERMLALRSQPPETNQEGQASRQGDGQQDKPDAGPL